MWAEVKKLGILGEEDDPSKLSILPENKQLNNVIACNNLHILCLYKTHLDLSVAKGNKLEEC